jgi:hypothetical protein
MKAGDLGKALLALTPKASSLAALYTAADDMAVIEARKAIINMDFNDPDSAKDNIRNVKKYTELANILRQQYQWEVAHG